MRLIKESARTLPPVSLVLVDWSVRESFHLLHYLRQQTTPRDDFEVIVVEYYSRVSNALKPFADQIDTWLVLDMPANCYYHKHLMYNAGIVLARGDIVMIGDSDAMVKPTFIHSIIDAFDRDRNIVYHIDQFRNLRRDFYPFNYPPFEDVIGAGCINNVGGKTAGVLNTEDPIHARNYGACMCARRDDLIAIGGADIHVDYLGHICGPYEMTFRLMNFGRREVWDRNEFMYHTWHPGQAGADNYLGPHDGRHMSTTALEALASGRIAPLRESEAIALLRRDAGDRDAALARLIPPQAATEWSLDYLEANASHVRFASYKVPLGGYNGYRLVSEFGRVLAYRVAERTLDPAPAPETPAFEGASEDEVRAKIAEAAPPRQAAIARLAGWYCLPALALAMLARAAQRLPLPLGPRTKATLGLLAAPFALVVLSLLTPAPLIGWFRRLARAASAAAAEISHLAAALDNIVNEPRSGRGGSSVLLVKQRHVAFFLRLLQLLRLAPAATIRRAGNLDSLRVALADLDRTDWSGCLLVPSALFGDFREAIAAAPVAPQVVVI
jgi:plasmid stabilization system protein ParE